MTTAHRPTFDPARGKEISKGPAYHQRLLPAHTKLKVRQPGQGGDADKKDYRDLRAELLKAEAEHFAKVSGTTIKAKDEDGDSEMGEARAQIKGKDSERDSNQDEDSDDDSPEVKRRRILAETRDLDADSDGEDGGDGSSEEDDDDDDSDDDDEDETAELLRELEKIKRERAEQREKEEQEKAALEEAKREVGIAKGNPLLNSDAFAVKRRWDDDVIFKNQARGTDERGKKKEFVNDLLRSDFHKKFMSKYVR
ncbi:Cwf15/Cwc15 cell cycle control family protein [Peziza echinospora]|nr:Cwf15/Cwc15 cell cycle control family protein [Peziza echinospora]